MTVRILQGDCREVMASLPERSVHMCVTSPPYYSLRDYKIPPSIWGGDPECVHEWAEESVSTEAGKGNWAQGTNGRGELQPGGVDGKREPVRSTITRGTCLVCGAWRGCLGLEPTLDQYIAHIVECFREVWRVLRDDATCWVNIGDSFNAGRNGGHAGGTKGVSKPENAPKQSGANVPGLKPKDLMMVPARVALALQADGWWIRSEIVWAKKAPMPESVTDRPTSAHEKIYLLSKRGRYFYDAEAVREECATESNVRNKRDEAWGHKACMSPNGEGEREWNNPAGRNQRNVWHLSPEPLRDEHYAAYPTEIPRRAILAGTSEKGVCPGCGAPWLRVLDTGATKRQTFAGENGQQSHPPGASHTLVPISRETVGWGPSCACDAGDPIPATVLDPFGGSGTTGLVADRLGRDAVLIEMGEQYVAMGKRRITADAPLLASVS